MAFRSLRWSGDLAAAAPSLSKGPMPPGCHRLIIAIAPQSLWRAAAARALGAVS
jgi:hypothetical protein